MLTPALVVAAGMTYLYLQMKELREAPSGTHDKTHTERPTALAPRAANTHNYSPMMSRMPTVPSGQPSLVGVRAHPSATVLQHPELPMRHLGKQRFNEHLTETLDGDAIVKWQRDVSDRKWGGEEYNVGVVHFGVGSDSNQRRRIAPQAIRNPRNGYGMVSESATPLMTAF